MRVLVLLLVLVTVSAFGQTVLKSENFDSYNGGDNFGAVASGGFGKTWSGGTSDDAKVVDTLGYSGTNSIFIDEGNDIIFDLSDKTSGRYQVDFMMYVKELKAAYFNLLQNFSASGADYGVQVYFQPHGIAIIDAGGNNVDTLNVTQEEWFPIRVIVDIDNDFATLYFDSVEFASWKWSGGTYGYGTTNKLDAINFYGLNGNDGSSGFFVDDVVFSEVDGFDAPSNLTAVLVGNDINLEWDAPTGYTVAGYSITRNDVSIVNGLTSTAHTDENMYPASYTYKVRAEKEMAGYSSPSDSAVISINGGVAKDAVLLEIVTGTWCVNCPAAARGAEEMIDSNLNVAILEYHGGDDYQTDDAMTRINYYAATGYPTSIFDGTTTVGGGGYDGSNYDRYILPYENALENKSVVDLNVRASHNGEGEYTLDITLEELYAYYESGLRLRVATTESHIEESWYGMDYLDFVVRGMYPSASGTLLDFSSESILSKQIVFTPSDSMNLDHSEIVIFVQHSSSKEVLQTQKIAFKHIYHTNVEEWENAIEFYPNPAQDVLRIEGNSINQVEIFSMDGKKVYSDAFTDNSIDISFMRKGIYIVKVLMGDRIVTQKLIKE